MQKAESANEQHRFSKAGHHVDADKEERRHADDSRKSRLDHRPTDDR